MRTAIPVRNPLPNMHGTPLRVFTGLASELGETLSLMDGPRIESKEPIADFSIVQVTSRKIGVAILPRQEGCAPGNEWHRATHVSLDCFSKVF